MAGNEQADGIGGIRAADGAGGTRVAQFRGKFTVGAGLTKRDALERTPHALLKRRAARGERQTELAAAGRQNSR
jgi:hypothetical protein